MLGQICVPVLKLHQFSPSLNVTSKQVPLLSNEHNAYHWKSSYRLSQRPPTLSPFPTLSFSLRRSQEDTRDQYY